MVCSLRFNYLLVSSECFVHWLISTSYVLSTFCSYTLPLPLPPPHTAWLPLSVGGIHLPNGSHSSSFLSTGRWCQASEPQTVLELLESTYFMTEDSLSRNQCSYRLFFPQRTQFLGLRMFAYLLDLPLFYSIFFWAQSKIISLSPLCSELWPRNWILAWRI